MSAPPAPPPVAAAAGPVPPSTALVALPSLGDDVEGAELEEVAKDREGRAVERRVVGIRTRDAEESDDEEAAYNAAYDARELVKRQEEAEKMKHVLAHFTPDQLDQYECFRRSVLSRKEVKKLVASTSGVQLKDTPLLLVSGLAKTFVGELVEEAVRVRADFGEPAGGPLRPTHLQEAHRRLAARGKIFSPLRHASALGGRSAGSRGRM